VIIVELGPDMDRFASDWHAASWAGICPGNNESAGKRRSGRPRNGNPYLRVALTESANAAVRTKNTNLRAQYEQVKRRRGHKKAIIAVAHSILIASYHILKDQTPDHDLGGDYFARRADPVADPPGHGRAPVSGIDAGGAARRPPPCGRLWLAIASEPHTAERLFEWPR
jgi:transposase